MLFLFLCFAAKNQILFCTVIYFDSLAVKEWNKCDSVILLTKPKDARRTLVDLSEILTFWTVVFLKSNAKNGLSCAIWVLVGYLSPLFFTRY